MDLLHPPFTLQLPEAARRSLRYLFDGVWENDAASMDRGVYLDLLREQMVKAGFDEGFYLESTDRLLKATDPVWEYEMITMSLQSLVTMGFIKNEYRITRCEWLPRGAGDIVRGWMFRGNVVWDCSGRSMFWEFTSEDGWVEVDGAEAIFHRRPKAWYATSGGEWIYIL
jgi:hypothetical protein